MVAILRGRSADAIDTGGAATTAAVTLFGMADCGRRTKADPVYQSVFFRVQFAGSTIFHGQDIPASAVRHAAHGGISEARMFVKASLMDPTFRPGSFVVDAVE